MTDTVARMNEIIYRYGDWRCPPLWRPFAFRRWQVAARAELKRLYDLRCSEVVLTADPDYWAPEPDDATRRHADVIKVVIQRELGCGFREGQRVAWAVADALAETGGPFGWPHFGPDDIEALADDLSDEFSGGLWHCEAMDAVDALRLLAPALRETR